MTGKDLFQEIGTIKEEYIAEAQNYKRSFIHNAVFKRSLAAAACLVLCLGIYWGVQLQDETTVMDAAEQTADSAKQEAATTKQDKPAVIEHDEALSVSTESMQDGLIQAETSSTLAGNVEEQKVEYFPPNTYTKTTESATEEKEKTEEAPKNPVSSDTAIMQMQSAAVPDLAKIKKQLAEYPADFEAICQEDAYIIVHGRVEKGQERWEAFMEAVQKQESASIDIVGFTVEGDPIITYLSFDGQGFYVVRDDTRDAWGSGRITENTFLYLYIIQDEQGTEAFLAGDSDLTGEQLRSGEYQTYSLFQRNDE